MKKTGNYDYVDVARGVLMIWVVFTHILSFVFRDTDSVIVESFNLLCMPLFFVFSGFLSFSNALSPEIFKKRLRNRLYRQLWPTICIFILFITFWHGTMSDGGISYGDFLMSKINDRMKGGYWFTLVLFEVFIIFTLCQRLISKRGLAVSTYLYLLISFLVIRCLIHKILPFIPSSISGGMSLSLMLIYSPFFYIGVVFRIYYDRIEKYISVKWGYGLLLLTIVAVGSCIVGKNNIWCYVFVPMSLFGLNSLKDYLAEKHKVPRILKYIGKRTLPIYLLHYFLIFTLVRADCAIFSRLSPITGNLAALLMALGIICVCIAADVIMKKHIPSVHNFIFSPLELRERMSLKAAGAEQKN